MEGLKQCAGMASWICFIVKVGSSKGWPWRSRCGGRFSSFFIVVEVDVEVGSVEVEVISFEAMVGSCFPPGEELADRVNGGMVAISSESEVI